MVYYLIQYADGMTSLTHTIKTVMRAALNDGLAEIVAVENSLVDILFEIARLGL